LRIRATGDRCYDFKKYFCQTIGEKIGVFDSKTKLNYANNLIITLVFEKKRQFFRRKLSKIAENCDYNIDPGLAEFSPICLLWAVFFENFIRT
jgi:hypothetical protein